MTTVIDDMIRVLALNGIDLRAFDDDLSTPEYPEGSISWAEFYESEQIQEKTGFSSKMYATVDNSGLDICSIRNSDFVPYDAESPLTFVELTKDTMKKFYRDL